MENQVIHNSFAEQQSYRKIFYGKLLLSVVFIE